MTLGFGLSDWRDRDSINWDEEDRGEPGRSGVWDMSCLKCQLDIHV